MIDAGRKWSWSASFFRTITSSSASSIPTSISIPASSSAPWGLPVAMFTPVFAVARTVGWVAHWNEMIADPETRLFRPRQLYTGSGERPPVPLADRAARCPLVG